MEFVGGLNAWFIGGINHTWHSAYIRGELCSNQRGTSSPPRPFFNAFKSIKNFNREHPWACALPRLWYSIRHQIHSHSSPKNQVTYSWTRNVNQASTNWGAWMGSDTNWRRSGQCKSAALNVYQRCGGLDSHKLTSSSFRQLQYTLVPRQLPA